MIEALEKCNLKAAQNCLKVPSKEASQYRRMVENEVNTYTNQLLVCSRLMKNYLMVMEKTFQIFKCLYKTNVKTIWMKEHNSTTENYFEIID